MSGDELCWRQQDERTRVMDLPPGGANWVEVKRSDTGREAAWRVDARLNGSHYKLADAFATEPAAQGSALLLAMRLLPGSRPALHAQLGEAAGKLSTPAANPAAPIAEASLKFSNRRTTSGDDDNIIGTGTHDCAPHSEDMRSNGLYYRCLDCAGRFLRPTE